MNGKLKLWSAVTFQCVAEYLATSNKPQREILDTTSIPATYRIKTETRDISEYAGLYGRYGDLSKLEETKQYMKSLNLSWARDNLDQAVERASSREIPYLDFINHDKRNLRR